MGIILIKVYQSKCHVFRSRFCWLVAQILSAASKEQTMPTMSLTQLVDQHAEVLTKHGCWVGKWWPPRFETTNEIYAVHYLVPGVRYGPNVRQISKSGLFKSETGSSDKLLDWVANTDRREIVLTEVERQNNRGRLFFSFLQKYSHKLSVSVCQPSSTSQT